MLFVFVFLVFTVTMRLSLFFLLNEHDDDDEWNRPNRQIGHYIFPGSVGTEVRYEMKPPLQASILQKYVCQRLSNKFGQCLSLTKIQQLVKDMAVDAHGGPVNSHQSVSHCGCDDV